MIIKILFLLFLPIIVFGNSTGTVSGLLPPTTFQLIMEDINQLPANIDKLEELVKELAKNPDTITGQALTTLKAYLEVEMRHKKQGRNYFGYISKPKYKRKE